MRTSCRTIARSDPCEGRPHPSSYRQGEEKEYGFRVAGADVATRAPRAPTRHSAAAPRDGRPDALVEVIPGDFSDDLEAGDRSGDFTPPRNNPSEPEGTRCPQ